MTPDPRQMDPRDLAALAESGRMLLEAHERFAELEQAMRLIGEWAEAEGAHAYAMRCLRAWQAEMDDPTPKPSCGCVECQFYATYGVGFRRTA